MAKQKFRLTVQINKIKKFSNKILKNNSQNICILGNDWLYYKRFHPVEFEKYKLINKNIFKIILNVILLFIKYQIKNIILLIFSITNIFIRQNNFNKKYDSLFVTYKFNEYYNFNNDAYFSEIYKLYKKNYKNFFVLAVNHQKNFFKKIKGRNFCELNKLNNFLEEFFFYTKLNYYFLKFFFKIFYYNSIFEKKFFLLLSINFLSGNTFDNLRYYFQIKKHIRKKKINSIISIYEGHALERLIFRAAKSINKKIKTIGYNHSFVTKKHNAVFLDLGNKNQADHIVFANQISRNIFEKKIKHKKKPLLFCVSKDFLKINNKKKHLKKNNICLIAPEGLKSETIKLFKFSLEYLKKYNDLIFIWRFHPIYYNRELNFIKKNFPSFFKFKKNIILSKKKLNEDFKISKYILYRGSSVVINAIKNNLIPINLVLKNEIENNFLKECNLFSNLKLKNIYEMSKIDNFKIDIKKICGNKKKILNLYSINNNNNNIKYYL